MSAAKPIYSELEEVQASQEPAANGSISAVLGSGFRTERAILVKSASH